MAEDNITIQVDEPYEFEVDTADLVAAVAAALRLEGRADAEVTVVITDDEEVAALNAQYRGVEGPTDVLSFPAQAPPPGPSTALRADAHAVPGATADENAPSVGREPALRSPRPKGVGSLSKGLPTEAPAGCGQPAPWPVVQDRLAARPGEILRQAQDRLLPIRWATIFGASPSTALRTDPSTTLRAGFVSAPEAANYLGDIVIALPYTRRQAAELGRPLQDELCLLAVHGILHLLGYDHAEPEEEAEMWARQDAILEQVANGK